MKHQVIIPHFQRNESIRRYIPHTIKIQQGDTIRWINTDSKPHNLYFLKIYHPDPKNIEVLDEKIYLKSGEVEEIIFNHTCRRIDYVCKIHRMEVNSITIFNADDYKNMDNIQRLRYLSNIYNIRTPNLLNYLYENK
ncbi:MAG TPA: plastocyanin/azurin family copper-binding protein [Nitrososphaeraceae archaeon]|nr:plastocyanin/azurin family copper-binding protein [Nitrososphaeraceae archaeon]